jgi:hypothetical protein
MQTPGMLGFRTSLVLIAIATLPVACAHSTRQLTTLPNESGATGEGDAGRTVVLFRVAGDDDGTPSPATLSTLPRWKHHYLVNVGPTGHLLDSGRAFGAGQLDSASREAGWGFVTLPPGTYQLAFAAYRTRFAMPGAQRAPLGFGQSSASHLTVPSDANLLYIGTFGFTCHNVHHWWGYVEHECTKQELRDEQELARRVASTSLIRFGPMQLGLASTSPVESSR